MAVALTPRVRVITEGEVAKSAPTPKQAATQVRKGVTVFCPDMRFAANVLLELGLDEQTVQARIDLAMGTHYHAPLVKHLLGRHDQSTHGRRGTPASLFRRAKAGGFTFNPASRTYPHSGYAVAVKGFSRILPPEVFTAENLVEYLDSHTERFASTPGLHLGGWYDRDHDEVVLDLVEVIDDLDEAVTAGVSRDEQAIFDLKNLVEIPTGGTGGRDTLVKRGGEASRELGTAHPGAEDGVGAGVRGPGASGPESAYEWLAKHGGPGPHLTGTPQAVHGGGGGPSGDLRLLYSAQSLNPTPATASKYVGQEWHSATIAAHAPHIDEAKASDINAYLKSQVAKQGLFVRVSSTVLDRVLSDGRFKSQHETGTSNGAFNPSLRAKVELALHGVNVTRDPSAATIYGYLTENPYGHADLTVEDANSWGAHADPVSQYGDITLVIKDSVRPRTTMTLGDSLDDTGVLLAVGLGAIDVDLSTDEVMIPETVQMLISRSPVPLTDPTHLAGSGHHLAYAPLDRIPSLEGLVDGIGPYVEAQIHEGLMVSDIERAIIPESTYGISALLPLLTAHNIPWTVLGMEEDPDDEEAEPIVVERESSP